MRQNMRNNDDGGNRLFSQLAAEKKKGVIAFCLIAVMAAMWVRVLMKKTPQSAEAAFPAQQAHTEGQSQPELKISFVELPEVPGRNDLISRDIFDSELWRDFSTDDEANNTVGLQEVNVISTDASEELVAQVAQQLKLQAIVLVDPPRVFINDTMLSVGENLVVDDGRERYEFEVIEIKKDMVLMRCREAEITLKLTQTVEW